MPFNKRKIFNRAPREPLNNDGVVERWKAAHSTISDVFRMFCRRTNGHGWRRIVRAPTLRGTSFWFILSFVAFLFACSYTFSLLTAFLRYETEQSIETRVGRQRFPAVTVCSVNPIKRSQAWRAEPASYRERLTEIPDKIHRQLKQINSLIDRDLDPQFEAAQDLIRAADYTTESQRRALGYTADELVAYCAFDEIVCADWKEVAVQHHDREFGNCYTWNHDGSAGEVSPGIHKGLHLVLKVNIEDYLPYYTSSEAAVVVIHEPGLMPLPVLDGQTVPADFETHLALEAVTFERLGYPYNGDGCQDNYKDFERRFGYTYSTAACQSVCKQLSMLEKCGCADMRLVAPIEGREPLCNTTERNTIACITEAEYEFEKDPDERCKCPMRCTETTYVRHMSIAKWPAQAMKARFEETYGFKHNRTASVRIYYRTPMQLIYRDIPRETTYQFLGWLGGQLCVWSGASIITIIEFICMLLACALVLFTENVDWLLDDPNHYEY